MKLHRLRQLLTAMFNSSLNYNHLLKATKWIILISSTTFLRTSSAVLLESNYLQFVASRRIELSDTEQHHYPQEAGKSY